MIEKLEKRLNELGRTAIAYSGGIDSSFLLYVANKVLGRENVLAVIVKGEMISVRDYEEAISFLKENDFNYEEVSYDCFSVTEFRENHRDRCYHCKKNILLKVINTAEKYGFTCVSDGNNSDDSKVYRPGNKASKELGIVSLLEETGFTKQDIRNESRRLGISQWNKPSDSCLATRFPYNTTISCKDLKKVEEAEEIIRNMGINRMRVRVHNDIARIEVEREYFHIIAKDKHICEKIKKLGFKFVTLDLEGIKSGSFD